MRNRHIPRTRNVPYVYHKEFYFVSYDESHDDYVKCERPIFMGFFFKK